MLRFLDYFGDTENADNDTQNEEEDIHCPQCDHILFEIKATALTNYNNDESIMCNICEGVVDKSDYIFQCKECDEYEICNHCANEILMQTKDTSESADNELSSIDKRVKFTPRRHLSNILHFEIDDEEYSHEIIKKAGCQCMSIYKMTKKQLLEKMRFLVPESVAKGLQKMLKAELLQRVKEIEMNLYGRYDVSCVNPSNCCCAAKGTACGEDCECQLHEQDTIYANYHSSQPLDEETDEKLRIKQKKMDSYICGNKKNSLNVQSYVLQTKDAADIDREFGIIQKINDL